MFMKKGLLTLAAATCLFGLASCSSAPSTEGFDPNEEEFEKKDLTLALVGDFKAEATGTTSINLSWSQISGINGYEIYRKDDSAGAD